MKETLEQWQLMIQETDDQINRLREVFGCGESDFLDAMNKLQCEYTKAVAESVGDKGGWLIWYWLDNALGKNKMQAGYDSDLNEIEIVDQLIDLVLISAQRSDAD